MISLENEKALQILKNKKVLGIDFLDKKDDEDDKLIVVFSDSFKLVIQTFWRIYKEFQDLPFNKSLLSKNLDAVRIKCLNAVVKNIIINKFKDLLLELNNGITIQGIINCRCKFYMYYGLFSKDNNIVKCYIDWDNS